MKLMLQPPTNHLVLWFCPNAFYKHKPDKQGKQQVSLTHLQMAVKSFTQPEEELYI